MGEISNICNEGPVLDNSTPESLAGVQERVEGAEGGGLETRKNYLGELSENAIVNRAAGETICEICGKQYYQHPYYSYPGFSHGPHKICDSEILYHL